MKLSELKKGQSALIVKVGSDDLSSHGRAQESYLRRLIEIGFLEGARVEVSLEAPWSLDPIAVRVRGALIALRRHEAELIEVELTPEVVI